MWLMYDHDRWLEYGYADALVAHQRPHMPLVSRQEHNVGLLVKARSGFNSAKRIPVIPGY